MHTKTATIARRWARFSIPLLVMAIGFIVIDHVSVGTSLILIGASLVLGAVLAVLDAQTRSLTSNTHSRSPR